MNTDFKVGDKVILNHFQTNRRSWNDISTILYIEKDGVLLESADGRKEYRYLKYYRMRHYRPDKDAPMQWRQGV
jgi:hypothetical protein